jgi:AraC-like DNA-binding protein
VRQQLADFYLRHSHFNVQHVTHLLGFHDHSSFHKACLRWFGMTPGEYRVIQSNLRQPYALGLDVRKARQ